MATRTGPIAFFIISWYSSGRSRPRLSTARDMTCQCRSMSRTLAASSTQRLVSHAHGHSGSNQKSTRAFVGALCTASVIVWLLRGPSTGRSRRSPWKPIRIGRRLFPRRWFPRGAAVSPPHGKLPCVAVPNLTRTDAAARAELLAVQFTARQAGVETFIDLVADTVHSATLNGTELDVSTYTEDGGLPLPGLAG